MWFTCNYRIEISEVEVRISPPLLATVNYNAKNLVNDVTVTQTKRDLISCTWVRAVKKGAITQVANGRISTRPCDCPVWPSYRQLAFFFTTRLARLGRSAKTFMQYKSHVTLRSTAVNSKIFGYAEYLRKCNWNIVRVCMLMCVKTDSMDKRKAQRGMQARL